MLNNDFFYIRSVTNEDNTIVAALQLNPEHIIFHGHFPGQPVVPGVCQVQIIKEILEAQTGKSLQLTTADHIKFLSVIVPDKDAVINAAIKYTEEPNGFAVTASLTKDDKVCLKMKGVLAKQ